MIGLTVARYLCSLLAPLIMLVTVAVAYLVSIRLVAVIAEQVGISVPPEVEPIMAALLFGVVTDYGLFYISRFRWRLRDGEEPGDATRETAAEITPLILACGIAVAAGSAALAVRPRAPASLRVGNCAGRARRAARRRNFHASRHGDGPPRAAVACLGDLFTTYRAHRLARPADRHGSAGPAPHRAGLPARARRHEQRPDPAQRRQTADPGAPANSEPRQTYEEISHGFAPGVAASITLVVTGHGVAAHRQALAPFRLC